MSAESAKSFTERLTLDQEFATKFRKYENSEDCIAASKDEGYDFTLAELKQVSTELSDEDLNNVSGGNHHSRMPGMMEWKWPW